MTNISRFLLGSVFAASASICQADVIGLYSGVGIWQSDSSGNLGKSAINTNDLGIDDSNSNFIYVAVEHPLPFIPNLRLQQTSLDQDGTSTIDSGFTSDDVTFAAGDMLRTTLDLTHQDIVLYYEILDNWVNLDLGLNFRRFDGALKVASSGQQESISLEGFLPMVYGDAQFDLPLTGLSFGATVTGTQFNHDTVTDYSVRIAYQSDIIPFMDLGIEAGYREMTLDMDELDDLQTDLTINGPYAAVTLHF